METATWCRTPATASAEKRLRPETSKNSSTALSSHEGELARSITTCVPAMASLGPPPGVVVATVLGGGGDALGPPRAKKGGVFRTNKAGAADNDDFHFR